MKILVLVRSMAFAFVAAALVSSSMAAEAKGAKALQSRAAFDKLKSLAGEWTGQFGEEGKKQDVTVVYKTTSNGSVLMETLFPGSPHEMVTVYYLEGDHLVLVHYCAAGNQPKMALVKSSVNGLEFDFAGGSNVKVRKDAHMHALRMTFDGKDKIATEWDYFKGGKKSDVTRFSFVRRAAS